MSRLLAFGVFRIIPAHAGNSVPESLPQQIESDHPRACGELLPECFCSTTHHGSSPRMRGTQILSARD